MMNADGQRNFQKPACIVGMIALTLFSISACATRGGDARENAAITRSVDALLAQHEDLGPPNEIYVQTLDHIVYLTGTVSAGEMRSTASEIALTAPGVTQVVNNIEVSK
jgi:osmotically-inducible protein OsmY